MRRLADLLLEADIVPDTKFKKQLEKAVKYLNTKGKVLLITTSNRGSMREKTYTIVLNLLVLQKQFKDL